MQITRKRGPLGGDEVMMVESPGWISAFIETKRFCLPPSDRISCGPGWSQTQYGAKDNLERLTLRPLSPECWITGMAHHSLWHCRLNPGLCVGQASTLPTGRHPWDILFLACAPLSLSLPPPSPSLPRLDREGSQCLANQVVFYQN